MSETVTCVMNRQQTAPAGNEVGQLSALPFALAITEPPAQHNNKVEQACTSSLQGAHLVLGLEVGLVMEGGQAVALHTHLGQSAVLQPLLEAAAQAESQQQPCVRPNADVRSAARCKEPGPAVCDCTTQDPDCTLHSLST